MRPAPEVHDALACLLTYPGQGSSRGPQGEHYANASDIVRRACPQTDEALERFLQGIVDLTPGQLEELYTQTFDNVADRSLEIGWQLFGENYARGVLMVRLRGLMRRYDVPESCELPDHLTHVLPLLARVPADLSRALVLEQVAPALDRVTEAFEAHASPWAGVLDATRVVLDLHVPDSALSEVTQ